MTGKRAERYEGITDGDGAGRNGDAEMVAFALELFLVLVCGLAGGVLWGLLVWGVEALFSRD